MTETPARPLVTFALFAYNQEKYIREAVEGAFAQTYEPLEIILSDDCSTDRTFEIMQEMAEAYDGPHDVKVLRNAENMDVAPHVLKRLHEAKGEFLILAAGDDISDPMRVERVVRCFQTSGAAGVHSSYRHVDETGNVISMNHRPTGDLHVRTWFGVEQLSFVHGATSAYSKRVLEHISSAPGKIHGEDGVLTSIILANGMTIAFLDEALVDYRSHPDSLSNSSKPDKDFASILRKEQKLARAAESYLALSDFVENIVRESPAKNLDKRGIISRIEKSRRVFRLRRGAYSSSFKIRAKSLTTCSSASELFFVSLRVFGLRFFARVKSLAKV